MAFEIKDMSGSLFINNKKDKETQPDFTGSIKIEGKEYRLSGWRKQSKNGLDYTSLQVKVDNGEYSKPQDSAQQAPYTPPVQQQYTPEPEPVYQATTNSDDWAYKANDNDLPF